MVLGCDIMKKTFFAVSCVLAFTLCSCGGSKQVANAGYYNNPYPQQQQQSATRQRRTVDPTYTLAKQEGDRMRAAQSATSHLEDVELENAESAVKKIVALHHPLRSARSKFNNLIVRWLFEGLVKQYNVELVLAGHEHTNHTLSKEETGGYEQIITNFSLKSYEDAKGESGRKSIILTIKR